MCFSLIILTFPYVSSWFQVLRIRMGQWVGRHKCGILDCTIMHIAGVPSLVPKQFECPYHDVIKWKHFPRYWPFVRGIHRCPLNSPHKGQWRGALMFTLICVRINGWVNNCETGDLRRNRAHDDVIVMKYRRVTTRDTRSNTTKQEYSRTVWNLRDWHALYIEFRKICK